MYSGPAHDLSALENVAGSSFLQQRSTFTVQSYSTQKLARKHDTGGHVQRRNGMVQLCGTVSERSHSCSMVSQGQEKTSE
mmetsp:Transcript_14525/g.29678  ORF Transcript_14525/g.29678 Transcript_14525/m.29678 type:complete len:80 (-) Transcript_14525:1405-1644(-)